MWNDIIAINQHGDAGADVRARVPDDLNSLDGVRVRVMRARVTDDLNSLEGVRVRVRRLGLLTVTVTVTLTLTR